MKEREKRKLRREKKRREASFKGFCKALFTGALVKEDFCCWVNARKRAV